MPEATLTDTAPVLAAQGLSYRYAPASAPVFAGVDLGIAPREVVCLIGASGAGKSTLLRVLAGLGVPTQGQVALDGETVHVGAGAASAVHAAKSSVVFQSPSLLPWLSVAQNAAFGLDFACRGGVARPHIDARVAAVLAQVGLAGHAHKRPAALSGGQAQRVALARALAREPRIIFLDEPFSALDAITREQMQDLLLELVHAHGSAALLVTHDIDEALRLADRVLLLAGAPGEPAGIAGEWRPDGTAPRQHRSGALNALRESILERLADPHRENAWVPVI